MTGVQTCALPIFDSAAVGQAGHAHQAAWRGQLWGEEPQRGGGARGAGGRGGKSYSLMGTNFQFFKMTRVLEMDGGDGCTTM